MKYILICLLVFCLASCMSSKRSYVDYYMKVHEADSVYRFDKDSLQAIKLYKKVFRKFPPKQTLYLDEFETYIKLSDKLNKKYGGEKSLNLLISLVGPNWKYKKYDRDFIRLYERNGIDSTSVENRVNQWKKGLNKALVDSFKIASIRDQEGKRADDLIRRTNDEKNEKLLFWTFKNYGYPSDQRIGLWTADGTFLLVPTILNHMAGSDKYVQLRSTLLHYVKSGDCPPHVLATMVDRYNHLHGLDSEFAFEGTIGLSPKNKIDTAQINRNRKDIGLPSIKHFQRLRSDFMGK